MSLRQAGLSLVELLIVVLIGSLLMLGVFTVLTGAKQSFNVQDELNRTQESARFAAEFIARDLRMAGYRGCRSDLPITSVLNTPNDWRYDFNMPVRGYVGVANFPSQFGASATVHPALSTLDHDPDALVVVRMDSEQRVAVAAEAPGALTLSNAHLFNAGTIMAVANCEQMSLFQVSHDDTGSTTLRHAVLGALAPGNCANELGGTCAAPAPAGYGMGASVTPLVTRVFYIGEGQGEVPGLFVGELTPPAGGLTKEELVPGVEDFQIAFGEDSDGDGVVNRWRRPNDGALVMANVTAVRIDLLLRTINAPDNDPKPYTFAGTTRTPTDGHVRRNFSMTINLRNRS